MTDRDPVGSNRIDGWGKALFEIATAEGQLEGAERDMFAVARAMADSSELRDALTNSQIPAERKQGIIDDLVGDRSSPLVKGLVSFIVGQGRASDLPGIVDSFVERSAASRSRAVAEIRSAIPLDSATVQRLAVALARATGKELEVKTIVDPDLIGGVVAQVGDVIIDGSVARRLSNLRQALRTG